MFRTNENDVGSFAKTTGKRQIREQYPGGQNQDLINTTQHISEAVQHQDQNVNVAFSLYAKESCALVLHGI